MLPARTSYALWKATASSHVFQSRTPLTPRRSPRSTKWPRIPSFSISVQRLHSYLFQAAQFVSSAISTRFHTDADAEQQHTTSIINGSNMDNTSNNMDNSNSSNKQQKRGQQQQQQQQQQHGQHGQQQQKQQKQKQQQQQQQQQQQNSARCLLVTRIGHVSFIPHQLVPRSNTQLFVLWPSPCPAV